MAWSFILWLSAYFLFPMLAVFTFARFRPTVTSRNLMYVGAFLMPALTVLLIALGFLALVIGDYSRDPNSLDDAPQRIFFMLAFSGTVIALLGIPLGLIASWLGTLGRKS